MCNKAILKNGGTLEFLIDIRLKKCIINLLIIMLMHWNLFLIDTSFKKNVLKLLILILQQTNSSYPSTIKYGEGQYKTQKVYVNAVNTYSFIFDSVADQ